eukprot:TRINITY_DN9020_c0_g1_i5.p1 TRINITY_DN9020_c0_g1~~TRINITY_DN9020_c0_g1_i5.p1  ORF type:complete len:477 (-),score=136.57 TRINITY_DN9020_c0_g1_i5:59-1489(-)
MNDLEVPTEQQSMSLMRNLLRTSLSCLTYLRHLFPEDCYEDKVLAGVHIKSLQGVNAESALLVKWLEEGVFDALTKKYLDTLVFCIFLDPGKPCTLLESYNYRFQYTAGHLHCQVEHSGSGPGSALNVSPRSFTKGYIKQQTISMLRTMVMLAQTLNPLPSDRFLTIKLFYNATAPAEYEPPYFMSATKDPAMAFQSVPLMIKLGAVQTPSHSLELRIKTTVDAVAESGTQTSESQSQTEAHNQPPPPSTPPPSSPPPSSPPQQPPQRPPTPAGKSASDELPKGDPEWRRVLEHLCGEDRTSQRALLQLCPSLRAAVYLRTLERLGAVSPPDPSKRRTRAVFKHRVRALLQELRESPLSESQSQSQHPAPEESSPEPDLCQRLQNTQISTSAALTLTSEQQSAEVPAAEVRVEMPLTKHIAAPAVTVPDAARYAKERLRRKDLDVADGTQHDESQQERKRKASIIKEPIHQKRARH